MRRRLGVVMAVVVLLAVTGFAASSSAESGAAAKYTHTYWTVRHHYRACHAGTNIRREGLTHGTAARDADYRRETHRLTRCIARQQPPMSGPLVASYYHDGGALACSRAASGLGVAHKTLPCGTSVQMQRCGNSSCSRGSGPVVTVTVDDRGPYIAGRTFDLNDASKSALGCGDLCNVRASAGG